ncbi:MAG: heme lyase CcmF/NrfE family subunit [Hyphomicrobiaceae bacterium]|nr:MAG: heme lyase CcmF/NrfE family subunit [Hyphomicrobiaceae bacterium]
MIIETGHFSLILALAVALMQSALPALGARQGDRGLMRVAAPAAVVQFLLVLVSFLALTHAFIVSDYSVELVARHSHETKPLIYRISGVWGNHEGSMLLWVLIVTLFGAAVAVFGTNLPSRLKANALAVQGSIGVAFIVFILLASNPFARLSPAAIEGSGLNPILQDPALAFHPPFLYGGYVGFSMAYSFAIAALLEGRIDAAWARWVRPWTLAAWMLLTIGIAMGSWWAYYTLGWGGWWFWDPVENASFMPWLAGTALLHSTAVMEKRESLKVWSVLLAILAFSLSLLGTFLVRSGVLTSVHAFAVDPRRGVFILGLMTVFIGGGLALFAWRAQDLKQGGIFAPLSREGSLVLNNVLLTVACGTVLVGTLYPLLLEALTGEKISVGPPYFNLTFGPLMIPLLFLLPFGPLLAWKRGDVAGAAQRLFAAGAVALGIGILIFAVNWRGPWFAPIGLALGVFVALGSLTELATRAKLGKAGREEMMRRLSNLPRSAWGSAIAHFGVGLTVIGIVATSAWQSEVVRTMKPGESVGIAGYELRFREVGSRLGPNWREEFGVFDVLRSGQSVASLDPAKRRFSVERQTVTEAAILRSFLGDLYVVLGDASSQGGYAVRMYFNPLVRLIWIGALVMFLGGALSLSDRRLRVGAPRLASPRAPRVPAE